MNLVFLGPPGAGKGTQAERMCKKYGFMHISTGAMLREQIEAQTEIGKLAAELIDRGEFVPDDIVIAMVEEKVNCPAARHGVILDGFPRTIAQAKLLLERMSIDAAINIDVHTDCLVSRIISRRTCTACDIVYNVDDVPDGVCTKCGGALTIRHDDTPEVFKERLHIYTERTLPIINYCNENGILKTVNGNQSVEMVEKEIAEVIERLKK